MDESESAAGLPEEINPLDGSQPEKPVQADQQAELLTEADFVPERRSKPPGPGIPESLAWVFGLVILQFVGSIVGLLLAFAAEGSKFTSQELLRQLQSPERQQQFVQEILKDPPVALFLGVQLVFLMGTLLAAAIRLGRNRRQSLPLGGIPIPHVVIIGLLIVPLLFFGQSLYNYAMESWELFVTYVPQLKGLTESSSMDQITLLAPKTSLALLMFLVAFVPAVAEELVFRGVIGRGLVARWGLPAGVLMTSMLFAAVHLHPVHAFALMPLAICIHVAYLSTRTFWAPMAIHFVNNAIGVLALKLVGDNAELIEQANSDGDPSLALFLTAGFLIVMLTALLWQMRVRFVLPDGTHWNPGYDGTDVPLRHAAAHKQYATPDWRLLVACAVATTAFLASIVLTSIETAADAV